MKMMDLFFRTKFIGFDEYVKLLSELESEYLASENEGKYEKICG